MSEAPRLLSIGEFLRTVGEMPPMLVQDLLPDNAIVLLTGKQKHGKSFVALEIADCVCQGLPVFGTFRVNRPGPVIYLDMENGKYEIANRTRRRGMKADDPRRLYVYDQRLLLSKSEQVDALKQLAKDIQPVLLIVDTAREALGVKDWNDAGEVSDKMRPLREFSRDVCTVLLLHHNRKAEGENGDEISGSNAVTSSVDGWLSCTQKAFTKEGHMCTLYNLDGRSGMRGSLVLEMDTHSLHIRQVDQQEFEQEAATTKEDTQQARLQKGLDAFKQAPDHKLTVSGLATRLMMNYKTAQRLVTDLVKAGLVEDTGEKVGKSKNTPVYVLLEPQEEAPNPEENEWNAELDMDIDNANPGDLSRCPSVQDPNKPLTLPGAFAN